jgi:hypothetical protein
MEGTPMNVTLTQRQYRLGLLLSALGVLLFAVPSAVGHARQPGGGECNLATIQGVYASRLSGVRVQPDGTTAEVANISRYVRDGQGNYSATTVENTAGTVAHLATTGTYTVNPDCTGTQQGVGATGAVTHYELVIANGGQAVELLRTDAPVLSGTQTRE